MSIQDTINTRNISEILHFTTNRGVLGILDTQLLKSRARLNTDARLEYIFKANAEDRSRDLAWLDYVNLSISRINKFFFERSAGNWHKYADLWWCILSFSPEILAHQGVIFTTTNNIYTSVRRAPEKEGLEAAFADKIKWYRDIVIFRDQALPENMTTCEQAEVLYPGQLSTQYLRKIYVPSEEIEDELVAQIGAVGHTHVPIEVCAPLFSKLG